MEDYKKKYKDALERAKVVNPGTTDYNIVTEIFPELKESEDERIRKALINVFSTHQDYEVFYGVSVEDIRAWLSWLEKQGEQKPAWSEEDENHKDALISLINAIKNQPLKRLEDWDCYINWLKALKERCIWKPSDEQMEALYTYIYNPQYFNPSDPRMELVESVYKDFKKLKEE